MDIPVYGNIFRKYLIIFRKIVQIWKIFCGYSSSWEYFDKIFINFMKNCTNLEKFCRCLICQTDLIRTKFRSVVNAIVALKTLTTMSEYTFINLLFTTFMNNYE